MAIVEAYTDTATIGSTEYSLPNDSTTLTPITADGVYQVFLDVSAVAAGDEFQIAIKEKAISGGTQRNVVTVTLIGAQVDPIWVSPTFVMLHGWDVTIDKIAGTDRSFSWSIRQVA